MFLPHVAHHLSLFAGPRRRHSARGAPAIRDSRIVPGANGSIRQRTEATSRWGVLTSPLCPRRVRCGHRLAVSAIGQTRRGEESCVKVCVAAVGESGITVAGVQIALAALVDKN